MHYSSYHQSCLTWPPRLSSSLMGSPFVDTSQSRCPFKLSHDRPLLKTWTEKSRSSPPPGTLLVSLLIAAVIYVRQYLNLLAFKISTIFNMWAELYWTERQNCNKVTRRTHPSPAGVVNSLTSEIKAIQRQ